MCLQHARLKRMPAQLTALNVSKMMIVKEMYLDNDELKRLPEDFGNLFNIYELRLMSNELSSLPASICKPTSLQLPFLRSNNTGAPGEEIGNCKAVASWDWRRSSGTQRACAKQYGGKLWMSWQHSSKMMFYSIPDPSRKRCSASLACVSTTTSSGVVDCVLAV